MKKKIIIIGIAAIIIIAAFMVIKRIKGDAPVNNLMPVEAEKVKRDTVTNTIKADGEVEFKDKSFVYAGSSAEIKNVFVEVVDTVKKGQVIIEYDKEALDELKNQLSDAQLNLKEAKISLQKSQIPADENDIKQAQIKVSQAESNIDEAKYKLQQLEVSIKQAKTNYENAQKDYDSNKILFDNGVISKEELDKYDKAVVETKNTLDGYNSQYEAEKLAISSAQKNLEIAETEYDSIVNKNKLNSNQKEIEVNKVQVEKAELKIKQLQKDINDFRINETAPVDGTVVKLNAEKGEIPSQGTSLVEIGNINELIVKADIDEYDMKDVKIGQKAEIKGDSFNGKINGTISKIYPTAEEKEKSGSRKTMVTVEIAVDKDNLGLLKAGYTIKAEITTNINENALVIPITSVMTDKNGNDYVYIINEQNIVEKKDIYLKGYSDMYIEIEGLNDGETVIIQPDSVSEGMIVSAVIAGEQETSAE